MSDGNPQFKPTPEAAALEAEAAKRRQALKKKGAANELEIRDTQIGGHRAGEDNIMPLKAVMKEAMGVFARMAANSQAFYADVRKQAEGTPKTIPCQADETHPPRPFDIDLTANRTHDRGKFCPVYSPCEICQQESESRLHWSRFGLPQRVVDATFENYQHPRKDQAEARAKVMGWVDAGGIFLILLGTPGTGKGHLAAAALKAHGSGCFLTQADMLAQLRASYGAEGSQSTQAVMAKWKAANCLVLDEYGVSVGGKDEEPMLYNVLADRYDKSRPTIITTNLSPEEFKTSIGARLLDRIKSDLVLVQMAWDSYRTKPL